MAVGSSSRRYLGVCARPREIATLWCCPADSSSDSRRARSETPIILRVRTEISTSSGVVFPSLWCGRRPIITVSMTVIENTPPLDTGTNAMILARSLVGISRISVPSRRTLPEEGLFIPSMHLTSVDFPTPLGPMMQYSPGPSISRSIPCRTSVSPYEKSSPSTVRLNPRPPSSV